MRGVNASSEIDFRGSLCTYVWACTDRTDRARIEAACWYVLARAYDNIEPHREFDTVLVATPGTRHYRLGIP